jgi:hypothetical protein
LISKWFGISELKKRIERFYAGDAEAVPSIFEAILKRKLAGKHDEADKKVMEEICGKREDPPDDIDHGKKTVRKTRARDE